MGNNEVLQAVVEGCKASSTDESCRVTCGGLLTVDQPVRLLFDAKDQGWQPWTPDCSLTQLTKACSEATFGKGSQEVSDPEYRSAKVLHAASFCTDFRLEQHSILSEIAAISCPDASTLTAQLDKLNVYSEGDFFRPHIDTPHGTSMIGSLIVCLPCPHQGGALVVSHAGSDISYDWGSSLQSQPEAIHWAFLYSDVQHEVQPVTAGHRLTLTYHIFAQPAKQPPKPSLDLAAMPLGQALSKALSSPDFHPEGGTLGFACYHLYPHTGKGFTARMLKGADRLVMQTAAALQLKAALKPVWKGTGYDMCIEEEMGLEEGYKCPCQKCCQADGRVSDRYAVGGPLHFHEAHDLVQDDDGFGELFMPPSWKTCSAGKITWVQSAFQWQPGMVGMAWGNEPSIGTLYSAAAIIVQIPAADKRCTGS